jgi:hypothetical protein
MQWIPRNFHNARTPFFIARFDHFRGRQINVQVEAAMPLFETEPPIRVPTPREVAEWHRKECEQARQQEEERELDLWIDLGGES